MKPRRMYSNSFRRQVVEEVENGIKSIAQVLREHGMSSSQFYSWREKHKRGQLDNEPTSEGQALNKIAELERKIGQLTMENDVLKKARELYQKRISEQSSQMGRMAVSPGGAK